MGKILAIDLGTKRVGLALSDPLKMIATPLAVIPFTSTSNLVARIEKVIAEQAIEKTVIGLPIREDGTEGSGCVASRSLAEALGKKGYVAILWDERYSSKIAEYYLRECGVKHKDTKDKLDSLSACVLLDSYLQSINRPG
jgi:putative Holliday junction resolvase